MNPLPLSRERDRRGSARVRALLLAYPRRPRTKGFKHRGQHAVHVLRHVVVPETDHAVTAPFQICRPPRVDVLTMLASIEFDDQTRVDAEEVGDEWADRGLEPELVSRQSSVADALPEALLRLCPVAAKFLCVRAGAGTKRLHCGVVPHDLTCARALTLALPRLSLSRKGGRGLEKDGPTCPRPSDDARPSR